jgi:gliding motility-associated-like protein
MVNVTGGTGPYQYVWSNNQTTQTATALSAQLYSVTVSDALGCTVSAAATLSQPALPLSFTTVTTQVKCPGQHNGTISVFATGGTTPYDYSATPDGSNFYYATNGIIIDLDSGWYVVTVSDSNGCTTQDSAYIPSPVPDYFSIIVDSTTCFGPQYADGAIHVIGLTNQNLPYQFALDSGALQISGDFYYVSAGPHVITAVNNFGCTSYLDTVVPQPAAAFAFILPKDTTLQLGQTIQLSTTFGPYSGSTISSYFWSPSLGLSCIDCPDPVVTSYNHINQYSVVITYNNNCFVTDSMRLIIQNVPHFFIPNSFSPNGDGNNDVFLVYGEHIKTIDLKIFNRWGELLFESENELTGWDGSYKGTIQNPGVYVYEVLITFLDDTQLQKRGSVTLIR